MSYILLANILVPTFSIRVWLWNGIKFDPITAFKIKWQKLWQLECPIESNLQILRFMKFGGDWLRWDKRSKEVWYIGER